MEQLPGKPHWYNLHQGEVHVLSFCYPFIPVLLLDCCLLCTGLRLLSVLEAAVFSAALRGRAGKVSLTTTTTMLLGCKHCACPAFRHAAQMEIVAIIHIDHDAHVCPFTCAARCMFGKAAFLLCRFDPATSDINDLKRLLTFSSKFVNSLHLQQLPSHLDLQVIFDAMRRWDRSLPNIALPRHPITVSCILVTMNDALEKGACKPP